MRKTEEPLGRQSKGITVCRFVILKNLFGCPVANRRECGKCHSSPKPSLVPGRVNAFSHALPAKSKNFVRAGLRLVSFTAVSPMPKAAPST